MPKKEQELEGLGFKQIAAASWGKGEVALYGLTEDGGVYMFRVKRGLWLPLPMMTPKGVVSKSTGGRVRMVQIDPDGTQRVLEI